MNPLAQSAAGQAPRTRWPEVVGVLGIVLAILTLFDKAGDLLVLTFSEADWSRWLGPEIAELVVRVMPNAGWLAVTSLVWMGLAVLLLVGSLRLLRRRRSGVALCRLWSGLAIGWILVDVVSGLVWFGGLVDELPMPAGNAWQGSVAAGVLFLLAFLLSFPVFQLVWYGRPAVRREVEGWPA